MTTNKELILKNLGYEDSVKYSLPTSGMQASIESLRAFVEKNGNETHFESMGVFHITGPAVKDNAAPLKAIGALITAIQDGIDSLGGALDGFTSLKGKIPSRITKRTEMSLIASPLPGSITLQVAPSLSREMDLKPYGETLFDLEELGFSPLADQAFNEFSTLLEELSEEGPDKTAFLDHLTSLGPRAANSMKKICDAVCSSDVDVDFTWREPGRAERKVQIDHIFAKHASTIIENANINCEEELVIGTIVTITESPKDKLRIRKDETEEDVTLALGSIDPIDLASINVGDRVEVSAIRTTSSRTGGRNTSRLEGVSISVIPKIDLQND